MSSPAPAPGVGLLPRLAKNANLIRSTIKVPEYSSPSSPSSTREVSHRVGQESFTELPTDVPWGPRQFAELHRNEQNLFQRHQELKRGGRHERLGKVASCERLLRDDDVNAMLEMDPLPNNVRLGRAGQPRRADNHLAKAAKKTQNKQAVAKEASPDSEVSDPDDDSRLEDHIAQSEKSKQERGRLFAQLEAITKVGEKSALDKPRKKVRAVAAVMGLRAHKHEEEVESSQAMSRWTTDPKLDKQISFPSQSQDRPIKEIDKDRAGRLNYERQKAALESFQAKERRAEQHFQKQRAQRNASIEERRLQEDGRIKQAISRRDRRLEERVQEISAKADADDINSRRRIRDLAEEKKKEWQQRRLEREMQLVEYKERQTALKDMNKIMDAARNLRKHKRGINSPEHTPENSPRAHGSFPGQKACKASVLRSSLPVVEKPIAKVDDELGKTLEWFSTDAYRKEWGAKKPPARRNSKAGIVEKGRKSGKELRASPSEMVEESQTLKDPHTSQLQAAGYDVDFEHRIRSRAQREIKASAPNPGSISPASTRGSFCGKTWRGGSRFVSGGATANPVTKRKMSLLTQTISALNNTAMLGEDGSETEEAAT